MYLDIVIVTYNSKKWLENCIHSICNQKKIDLRKINLVFVDNISKDDTIDYLEKKKDECESILGEFNIIKSSQNLGFGKANNLGGDNCKSEYILFLNPDTELEEDAIFEVFNYIRNSSKEFAIFELRQKIYEHPKIYDPVTSETTWASGACLVIKREIFKKIKGFDSKIFMYAEDVDLSWNVRLHGYKIKYMPKSIVYHYCYKEAGEIKPIQYWYSIINNLNLRMKYGTLRNIVRGHIELIKVLKRKGPFKGSRIGLVKKYLKNIINIPYFLFWRYKNKNSKLVKSFKPRFYGFDYEINRYGAFLESLEMNKRPLVSVVVRTCGRPNLLRECLTSIKNQTYDNIEVIIMEDGKNISEPMIKNEFSDLNILYNYTDEKVGRCEVGNRALSLANGKYLNFLDDDDFFYADHVETLVSYLEKEEEKYKIAYALSFESKVTYQTVSGEKKYKEIEKVLAHVKPFSRITLLTRNAFPIQTVMFSKEIYDKYGGFDLSLDNLEDWELWARYAMENAFLYVPKVTSIYKVPYNNETYTDRQKEIDSYYEIAREKILSKNIVVNAKEFLEEAKYI